MIGVLYMPNVAFDRGFVPNHGMLAEVAELEQWRAVVRNHSSTTLDTSGSRWVAMKPVKQARVMSKMPTRSSSSDTYANGFTGWNDSAMARAPVGTWTSSASVCGSMIDRLRSP